MQVQVKPTFFQSFGGINFMDADLRKLGVSSLITGALGHRSPIATYSYADVLKPLLYFHAIGRDVLDQANILQQQLKDHPELKICSADTIEFVSQELRRQNREVTTAKGVMHTINEHEMFNKLLPKLCKLGGVLNTTGGLTMDYDGHITENTKPDNACSYKKTEGYYPVVCSINKLPVYMQNRKANTPESYRQLEVITKAFEQCRAEKINLAKFRADACCYEKETIVYMEAQQGLNYYVRAEMSVGLRIALEDERDWKPAMLNHKKVEVCSIEHKVFGEKRYRRIVAYRKKAKGQLSLETEGGYDYHAILTNDTGEEMSVIEFYNQRGCEGEHHFKELDNDFGWNKLPFDSIEMNTIYMYATIVAYLLFNICKAVYSAKVAFVKPQMQLKNFRLHFITLTAKWIKTARLWVLKIFTAKDCSPVFST